MSERQVPQSEVDRIVSSRLKRERRQSVSQPVKQASPRTAGDIEEATKVGFIGRETDTTPDENYTVAGVTSGKPVPPIHPRQA